MVLILVKFVFCALIILYCGKRVAKYGDMIAEKTGLSGLWIGIILVSVATSLPELFMGVGSTVFIDAPDLTVGNILGASTYNLANIGLLDFIHKGQPLLSAVSSGQLLTLILSIIPLLVAAGGIFMAAKFTQLSFANVSLYSVVIIISYFISTRIIFRYEQQQKQILDQIHKEEKRLFKYDNFSLKAACVRYAFSALIIAAAGIWLAYIGDELSHFSGLSQNFIGSLFLGFATTLPEITVSIAAIRLGAKELAVANMFGSNLFNAEIIAIDDILYRKAAIFNVLSQQHIFTVFIIIFMALILGAGMVLKPKRKIKFGVGNYTVALIIVFIVGAYINFALR